MISIAIDGPASSGKTTLSKMLSKKLSFVNFDTGSLYRAAALYFILNDIDVNDITEIRNHLKNIKIDFNFEKSSQETFLNGENVTNQIFKEDISIIASKISAFPEVRSFLLEAQRQVALNNNVIMNGRDIGTVVLPNADIKFFVTASPEVRAKRRFEQLRWKDRTLRYNDVLKHIKERDFGDTTREISPLTVAEDAIVINDSKSSANEVLEILLEYIKERFPKLVKNVVK